MRAAVAGASDWALIAREKEKERERERETPPGCGV